MPFIYWIFFLLLICLLVSIDLGFMHRKTRAMKVGEALCWSFFWIALALLFNIAIYFIYEHRPIGEGIGFYEKGGKQAALNFFAGYLLEKSLSLDNIFVISLIFSYYRIPLQYQHRVLTWGILSATVLRGIMIVLGVATVQKFHWSLYIFGMILLLSGIKFYIFGDKSDAPRENRVIKFATWLFPATKELRGSHFFVKENAKWMATPLLITLIHVELADIMFAVDSIPAIFAVTLDPFIIYTSNIFAIFGLRALYFALAPLIEQFHLLKSSLSLILIYIGIKMLIIDLYKIPTPATLAVISVLLAAGIAGSVIFPQKEK